ncbi:CinA family protein [Nocardia sp. NPDC005366]|uniref:CinA family protein n=1 Tax=Nocardia sp. NPDC005366 TaxID=3156878 RepID=UPI0033BD6DBF
MTGVELVAEELADVAKRTDLTIAVAESLTAGRLAATLGAATDAATWFRGGIVAYSRHVKHHVLDVPEGPVVCEAAADAMAEAVKSMMGAALALAVTGAGGPDPQDGHPPGSVWFSVAFGDTHFASHQQFDGGPERVVEQTVDHAVRLLLAAAEELYALNQMVDKS